MAYLDEAVSSIVLYLAVPGPAPQPDEPPAVVESVQETPVTNMPKFQRRRSSYSSPSETEDPKPMMRKWSVSSSTSSRESMSKNFAFT